MRGIMVIFLAVLIGSLGILTTGGMTAVVTEQTETVTKVKCEAKFSMYGDDISVILTEEETEIIMDMFEDAKLYRGNLACGFSANCSVRINDTDTYCIAMDTCNAIYWMEKDRYFDITEKELETLYGILEPYGFYFPCV